MTNQEKKAWLRRYRDLSMEIEYLRAELAMWHSKALNISFTVRDNVIPGSERNPIQDVIENIMGLENEIAQKIEELFLLRNEISRAIQNIKDPRLRNLLHYRYILCLTWEEIAKKLSISLRWVYRKHGQALKEILI